MSDQIVRSQSQTKSEVAESAALAIFRGAKLKLVTLHSDVKAVGSKRPVLCCDVSYSMVDKVGQGEGRLRKIDHLREAIKAFTGVRLLSFSSSVFPEEVKEPNGGTNMAAALRFIRDEEGYGADSVVMISDGEPNNEEDAIDAATSLGVPVHVIYIGEPGDRGERFMKRLADATGGQQYTADVNSVLLLSTSLSGAIRGLLGTGTGPIQL